MDPPPQELARQPSALLLYESLESSYVPNVSNIPELGDAWKPKDWNNEVVLCLLLFQLRSKCMRQTSRVYGVMEQN